VREVLFDTHTHYDEERYDGDRFETITQAHEKGIGYIVNVSNCMKTSHESVELADRFSFIYAATGIHPYYANEMNENNLTCIRELSSGKKVVAIGEIGLDYYNVFYSKLIQKECFAMQIDLAREMQLTIMVHDRDAHQDVFDMLVSNDAGDVGGIIHSYSGSVEMAGKFMNLGFFISFAGPITYLNARKIIDVVQYVPLDRLLIETDCPDLSPVPFRGIRNDSSRLGLIAEKVAAIKGISLQEVAEATTTNAKRLFKI